MIGGNVDLGLLLQSSKDQRVWVDGLGDIKEMSFQQWRREEKRAQLLGKQWGRRALKKDPQKLAVT